MSYVLKVIDMSGLVTKLDPSIDLDLGEFVLYIDVDAHNGGGSMVSTRDPRQAVKFNTAKEAIEYWSRQSTVRPLRADGKPNKPGTAVSIEIFGIGEHA